MAIFDMMDHEKTKSELQIEGSLDELQHAIKKKNKALDEYTNDKDLRQRENKNARDLLSTFEGRAVIIWFLDKSGIDHRRNVESAIRQLYKDKNIRDDWLWGDLMRVMEEEGYSEGTLRERFLQCYRANRSG